MFTIPLGPHPYPPGTVVRSRARPWWGVGVVVDPQSDRGGLFGVRWGDGLISWGQTAALDLVLAVAS